MRPLHAIRMKIILIVAILPLLISFAHGALRSDLARFYNQPQWGTAAFQLQRTADAELTVNVSHAGDYSFGDDGTTIEGVASVEAEWTGLDGVQVILVAIDEQGNSWQASKPAHEGINHWSIKDFNFIGGGPGGKTQDLPKDILSLNWQLHVTAKSQCKLRNCSIQLEDGPDRLLFLDQDKPAPLCIPELPQNLAVDPIDRQKPRVIIAENSVPLARDDWIKSWSKWASQEFPDQFGVDMNSVLFTNLKNATGAYRDAGQLTIFESHEVFPGQMVWVRNHGLSLHRFDGLNPDNALWPDAEVPNAGTYAAHAIDTTQKDVFDLVKTRMETVYALGFDSFLLVDYVWPYFGGKWGYGNDTVLQWKADLNGGGFKIDLDSPTESWGFADYWNNSSSIPLDPAEFGWKTWDDFVCGTDSASSQGPIEAKRLLLFNALWHYQHLVFLDRLGRVAETHRREFSVSINPEDINNGDDVSLMGRLRHLGSLGFEFFGNPSDLSALRHTLAHLRYRNGGPRLDLIGEINGGGHGPSRYDPAVAFAYYYEATASSLPRDYNVQYLESLWPDQKNLDKVQLGRFDHWFAGANSFLLRHAEETQAAPIRSPVTVIASRSVLEYQPTSSNSLDQDGNLARYLDAFNIDFEQVGRDIWNPLVDTHSIVLFFCPDMTTPAELQRVKSWVDAGQGKTLIVAGGAAWRSDRPPNDPAAEPGLGNMLLPVEVMKPSVALSLGGTSLTANVWGEGNQDNVVLAADDGQPLLTESAIGNNRVIHITPDLPGRDTSALGLKIISKVLSEINLQGGAQPDADWNLHRYMVPGGAAVVAWNKPTLATQGQVNHYDRVPIASPATLILNVQANTKFTIYSVFGGNSTEQQSTPHGQLTVTVAFAPEILYYGAESADFHTTVSTAATAWHNVLQRTRVQSSP